ncbi:hypothetical protein [Candidatus Ruminimicrobiellum ovillum]|uniref:hypothetical protein n=1 Tax=Candidatus Ruminimicrobiellum ovillum TaxID=1947927 RepID=UPI0035595A41
MSVFEIIMLLSFASAWPFSIYKSYTSRQNAGKSLLFMYVVELGYVAGLFHKYFYNMDGVFYLYLFNFLLVLVDICLYYRNLLIAKKII